MKIDRVTACLNYLQDQGIKEVSSIEGDDHMIEISGPSFSLLHPTKEGKTVFRVTSTSHPEITMIKSPVLNRSPAVTDKFAKKSKEIV